MARKAARKPSKPTKPARRPAPKRATAKRATAKRAPAKSAPARAGAARRLITLGEKGRTGGPPLSPAVAVGNLLFLAGQTPMAKDGSIARGDFAAQMHQVMANIKDILAAAGSSLDQVAKVNVILTRVSDFWTMNDIYKQYFNEGNYPARTTIEAPLAHPDFLVEIECIAAA